MADMRKRGLFPKYTAMNIATSLQYARVELSDLISIDDILVSKSVNHYEQKDIIIIATALVTHHSMTIMQLDFRRIIDRILNLSRPWRLDNSKYVDFFISTF